MTFKLFCFPIYWFWAYRMKIISKTRHMHWIRYLRFYFNNLIHVITEQKNDSYQFRICFAVMLNRLLFCTTHNVHSESCGKCWDFFFLAFIWQDYQISEKEIFHQKNESHDIAEILLKVALNTTTVTLTLKKRKALLFM
jgi:hypothetical protein